MEADADGSALIGSSVVAAIAAVMSAALGISVRNGDSELVLGLFSVDFAAGKWAVVLGVVLLPIAAVAARWKLGLIVTVAVGVSVVALSLIVRGSLLNDASAINRGSLGAKPRSRLARAVTGEISSVDAGTISVTLAVLAGAGLVTSLLAAFAIRRSGFRRPSSP